MFHLFDFVFTPAQCSFPNRDAQLQSMMRAAVAAQCHRSVCLILKHSAEEVEVKVVEVEVVVRAVQLLLLPLVARQCHRSVLLDIDEAITPV